MGEYTRGKWYVERDNMVVTDKLEICDVSNVDFIDNKYVCGAITKANARLIAAAPDLLNAAKKILAELHARIDAAPSNNIPVFNGIVELHSAINKAEK